MIVSSILGKRIYVQSYNTTLEVKSVKRKAARNQALKNNFTPTESLPDAEFAEINDDQDPMKGANRNSKQGKQGK